MLNDFTGADQVYIACGYTDLRKGIDGLARLVQQQFELDPFTNTLFLFCGRRRDRIKGLYWEKDGFILLYKTICNDLQFVETRIYLYNGKRKTWARKKAAISRRATAHRDGGLLLLRHIAFFWGVRGQQLFSPCFISFAQS